MSFLATICKGGSYPIKIQSFTPNVANVFSRYHLQRGVLPTKLQCLTPDLENVLPSYHYQLGSLTQPNSSAWLQILKTSFLDAMINGRVLPNQTPVHDSRSCKRLYSFPLHGGVLPNQTPVHDSICCKRLYSLSLARGESYPTKLKCITLNVANIFFCSH